MAIGDLSALPTGLQNAIQTNMLERKYLDALRNQEAYSRLTEVIELPAHQGQTLSFTRLAELVPSYTPIDPALIAGDLNDGLVPDTIGDEQFTFTLHRWAKTFDIDLITQKAMIADYTMKIVSRQGRQAGRTREGLSRNSLLNAYGGGNTVVLSVNSGANTMHVDDIRGFQIVWVNGTPSNVSNSGGYQLPVNDVTYNNLNPSTPIVLQITGATPDGTNVSSAALVGGMSGTLYFTEPTTYPSVGDQIQAVNAPKIFRPNGKSTTQQLTSMDLMSTTLALNAKTYLGSNGVEPYEDGFYRCVLPPTSMSQLFSDADFKLAYQGAYNSPEFRNGKIVRYQGIEYIETTEALIQVANSGTGVGLVPVTVNRPIVMGKGAVVRGDDGGIKEFAEEQQKRTTVHDHRYIDGILYSIRSPIDRLGEQLSSSWQMITSYCCPTQVTTTAATIPTAGMSAYKNAAEIEHAA
jgi:hypothetical protein